MTYVSSQHLGESKILHILQCEVCQKRLKYAINADFSRVRYIRRASKVCREVK